MLAEALADLMTSTHRGRPGAAPSRSRSSARPSAWRNGTEQRRPRRPPAVPGVRRDHDRHLRAHRVHRLRGAGRDDGDADDQPRAGRPGAVRARLRGTPRQRRGRHGRGGRLERPPRPRRLAGRVAGAVQRWRPWSAASPRRWRSWSAGRVLQGLGGGALTVSLYVVVGLVYPPALQPAVFASFAAAWVLPSLFGPGDRGLRRGTPSGGAGCSSAIVVLVARRCVPDRTGHPVPARDGARDTATSRHPGRGWSGPWSCAARRRSRSSCSGSQQRRRCWPARRRRARGVSCRVATAAARADALARRAEGCPR